jgi:hypothetical protein
MPTLGKCAEGHCAEYSKIPHAPSIWPSIRADMHSGQVKVTCTASGTGSNGTEVPTEGQGPAAPLAGLASGWPAIIAGRDPTTLVTTRGPGSRVNGRGTN